MSATLSKLRTSWVGRALLAYAVSALALVVLGLAAPGSAVFFPLVSLWCNLALFGLVLVVLRVADIEFDLFHWAVIIGFWAAALLYFYWAETRRSFVYIWDYVNYINKQYNAEAAFLQGPAVGFHFILDSLAEDYTNFNTLFLEFPFCLTDRTGDSFAICQVFSIVPMLLLLLAGLVVKVGQMLQVKNRFWYFLIGLSWTFTYPWLRMSAVLSQPDWFGLIFAFSILLLTLDFRFEKLDLPRFGLLFLATAAIILSRRWYLYFVVGYYFAYAVLVLVSSARIAKVGRKQETLLQVRNLILFGLMSMVAMVILLWPLVSHILGYDYADHYSYYNGGGMVTETYLQCARMGLMNLVLMGMGLWFCFKRRKMPALPCLAGLEILLSMVLFTRVQTTGSQHMLLFLPGWFLLFLIGAAALAEGMNRRRNLKIGFWLFTIAFATSVRCSPLTTVALPDFLIGRTLLSASPQESAHDFAAIDDLVYDRKDLPQIKAITDHDDMDLYTLGEKKCALYAVIPDNDTTFNFLVSLLYSQIFQTLYYCADQIHHGALPCHVHFILDEAPSVNLPGLPRELATMRSRNISCSTIIQNMAQIKELYKDSWETIPGNSDTLLYLGGNESSTHKYISEALGKSTIDTKTHGQTKGRSGSYSTNFQMSGRELLTPDEVRMLDNRYCILFIRGARPVLDLKYELMEHPAIRYTMDGGAPPYIHHGTATPTLPGEPLFRFAQNDEKENIA